MQTSKKAFSGATTIYVGGQNAVDVDGSLVGEGDVAAQSARALENARTALAAAGATLADVAQWTVLFVDGADLAAGYGAIASELASDEPALVTAARVAGPGVPGAFVEISAVAACCGESPRVTRTRAAAVTRRPESGTGAKPLCPAQRGVIPDSTRRTFFTRFVVRKSTRKGSLCQASYEHMTQRWLRACPGSIENRSRNYFGVAMKFLFAKGRPPNSMLQAAPISHPGPAKDSSCFLLRPGPLIIQTDYRSAGVLPPIQTAGPRRPPPHQRMPGTPLESQPFSLPGTCPASTRTRQTPASTHRERHHHDQAPL